MTEEGRLKGRGAFVTGASRGLGKAIAVAMAAEGASVAVVARSESQWHERLPGTIHETVQKIEAEGGRAVAIAVGLFASYRLMQLSLPDMIDHGRGAIVNISSAAGLMPGPGPYGRGGNPGPIAYGGNKAALHHLTQCVAAEVQPHGIPVNALLPSAPIITPGNLYAMPTL